MTAFRDVIERCLAPRASRQVRGLTASTALLDFAVAAISLFEPIYLYTLGWSLTSICLFYLAIYGLAFILMPFGGRLNRRFGFQHAILFSSPFLIAYYLSLYAIPAHPIFIGLAVLVFAVQKVLYWPGFHAEMARYGHDGERGREISNLSSASSLAAALGPAFGGVLIALGGFPAMFAVSSLLILISNIPFLSIPEAPEKEGLDIRAAYRRFFLPEHRRQILSTLGFGEEFVAMIAWPLFLYFTLKDTASTGVMVSVSVLLTTLSLLFIGRLSDRQSRHALVRTGAIFTAGSWLVRFIFRGAGGVLAGDFAHRIARASLGIPYMSLLYERSSKGPLMERIIVYEMGIIFGKVVAILACLAALWLFSGRLEALFPLAAGFSLLYMLLP